MNVGENIRRIRKEKGLTQKQLAKILNVSEPMISQYEAKESLKLDTIEKIANALDVFPFELTEAETSKPSSYYKKLGMIFGLAGFNDDSDVSMEEMVKLLELYMQLNHNGKIKAIEQVTLLTKIDEYKKKSKEK